MHSQTLLLLIGILGTQLYIFSCSLFLRSIDPPLSLTRRLINMDEGSLFFLLLTVLTGCLALGASLTLAWARSGFSGLQHANNLIGAVHFLGVAATASFGLLSVHTLKKARSSPS